MNNLNYIKHFPLFFKNNFFLFSMKFSNQTFKNKFFQKFQMLISLTNFSYLHILKNIYCLKYMFFK